MAEEFRVLRPYEYHCQLMNKGTRADGRKLTEFRSIKLETDGIRTASSSALVKLGNTSLVCGCTAQLRHSQVRNQTGADEIDVRIELPPICSSPTGYRMQHSAHLLTKALKNILEDTNCLDKFCLDVVDRDCFWSVDLEVICLNYDGCLLDAALISVLAALKTLRMEDSASNVPNSSFIINSTPVCSSYALIGNHLVCDPNLEEETIAQSTFSITVDSAMDNAKYHINKVGGKAVDANRLLECISLAKRRAVQVVKYLHDIGLEGVGSKDVKH